MGTIFLSFIILFSSLVKLNAQWYEQNSGTTKILRAVFFTNVNIGTIVVKMELS